MNDPNEGVTDASLMMFRGTTIRMRGERGAEQMCLTDMWKANGADPKRDVYDWTRSKQARDLAEYLGESTEPGNSRFAFFAEKGGAEGGGGTWAHWQLAFAYAKYLSPRFHVWVNQAAREKMDRMAGERAGHHAPSISIEEMIALAAATARATVETIVPIMRDLIREVSRPPQDDGTIGTARAKKLLSKVCEIACWGAQRGSKAWRAKHRSILTELRDGAELPATGKWENLSAATLPKLWASLTRIEKREYDASRPQGALFHLDPTRHQGPKS